MAMKKEDFQNSLEFIGYQYSLLHRLPVWQYSLVHRFQLQSPSHGLMYMRRAQSVITNTWCWVVGIVCNV